MISERTETMSKVNKLGEVKKARVTLETLFILSAYHGVVLTEEHVRHALMAAGNFTYSKFTAHNRKEYTAIEFNDNGSLVLGFSFEGEELEYGIFFN